MKRIAILGATGSIGRQAADIAQQFANEIDVVMLSAHTDAQGLAEVASLLHPQCVALTGKGDVELLEREQAGVRIAVGPDACIAMLRALQPDLVVHAMLGIAGLPAFAACLQSGIPVALANKESLVCGADVVRKMMDETGTPVYPVDSEHCALFQCLGNTYDTRDVARLWITASGGPFRTWDKSDIAGAPVEKALKHPRWNMGSKITIDSASLANKGLEVIEAHFMYGLAPEQISVLVHPQSIVHSMVEFIDGSVLAQMGPVDMRLPLQKAMLFPEMRENSTIKPLDFYTMGSLDFEKPDMERFPCLALAYEGIRTGTTAVYNIADEVAVGLYMDGKIRFGGISEMIERGMQKFGGVKPASVGEIGELDRAVRTYLLER